MSVEITMPQLSDTMNEGRILTWLKKEGDTVRRGDALAEVATDKADLEIESFHDGTLVKIHAQIGTTVKVGTVIAIIGEAGEAVGTSSPKPAAATPAPTPVASAPQPVPPPAPISRPTPVASAPVSAPVHAMSASAVSRPDSQQEDRVKISPLARNVAQTYGVDVANLEGSGEGGRIVKRDIEKQMGNNVVAMTPASAPAPQQAAQLAPPRPKPEVVPPISTGTAVNAGSAVNTEPLSKMREAIAQRMAESTRTIPHFYVTSKVHAEAIVKLRNSLKNLPQYEGLTYNHLIIKAAALALRTVPRINSAFREGQLVHPQEVNVGIITAVPDGLLIPVVRNADQLPLADIVSEGRMLVQRARSGRPKSTDLLGGTFSISNMGMFPVESFTAIINPNQGAILAVSGMQDEALVVDGKLQVGPAIRFTLSVDHRIIDGVMAGEFLKELKRLLEDPVLLLA